MTFSWEKSDKPIVCLAPMAGFTDSAFRQIVKEIEPRAICISELTSINALGHDSRKTEQMLSFAEIEQPLILQVFGNDMEFLSDAGRKLGHLGVAGIDINMGCPAPKVTKNCYGSALLENPELAGKMVSTLSKTVKIPVSVKLRIGYKSYDENKFLKFIKILEKSGASNLTIHGRTAKQGYSGLANFDPIYLAKNTVKIPVIGNGDIDSPEKALLRLRSPDGKTTLDGLMIGRAVIGNPWLIKDIYEALHRGRSGKETSRKTSEKTSEESQSQAPLSFKQKLPTIKKHFALALALHGEKIGLLEMRKHLGGYVTGIPDASHFRAEIFKEDNPEKVIELLEKIAKK